MVRKTIRRRWLKVVLGIGVLVIVTFCSGLAMITLWPNVAAQNIDRLRDVIGDEPVAQLEELVLNVQDQVQQLEYQFGLLHPAAPWADAQIGGTAFPDSPSDLSTVDPTTLADAASDVAAVAPTSTVSAPSVPVLPSPTTPNRVLPTAVAQLPTATTSIRSTPSDAAASPNPTIAPTLTPKALSVSAPTPVPVKAISNISPANVVPAWQLTPLTPLGKMAGEGIWTPYLYAPDGHTVVAYRTYLQADPKRPYSVAAIVAFNLQATRLHFVLGSIEPRSATPEPSRTGSIPDTDRRAGMLLAAFNGGFKARHGQYGAMADNLIALPAITGLATVGIYGDGQVQIGQWGKDIKDSPDLVAWRQNGEMLVHNGQINPDTARTTVAWGLTVKGEAVTWRSALGLSADTRTLYYVAGAQLDVPTLAKVMLQAGASEALQLDVNNFWVHFTAIRSDGSNLLAEPLLQAMKSEVDRYLKGYSRDFFYVTAVSRS